MTCPRTALLLAACAFAALAAGCGSSDHITSVSVETSCQDYDDATEALFRFKADSPDEKREASELLKSQKKLDEKFVVDHGAYGPQQFSTALTLSRKVRDYCKTNPDGTYGDALSANSDFVATAAQRSKAELHRIGRVALEAEEGGPDISPEAQSINESLKRQKEDIENLVPQGE